MKPIFEDISTYLSHSSFYAYSFKTHSFDFKWHFHPEYELTYIVRGNGYRLVGNNHQEFSDNDLVLIAPNLPHTWVGNAPNNDEPFEAIVIQFPSDFVQKILQFKENNYLIDFFEKAKTGLFFNDFSVEIKDLLFELTQANGIEKIAKLMLILSKLYLHNSISLSSSLYKYTLNQKFETRINKVCVYLQNHFTEPISLKQVADLVYMTESNFCKFFKKATSTTFSDYVNDLRINEACTLLLYSDENINQIAYTCGFESLSYFNRVFLKKKQSSPSVYRSKKISKV